MTINQSLVFHTTIPGTPKGQPRPRAFARKMGNGKYAARVYDAGTAEGWKSCVAAACKDLANRKIQDPLGVVLDFYMPRPKAHYRKSGQLSPSAPAIYAQTPDVDNLVKAVLDALTQIGAWGDDSQVIELNTTKKWANDGNPPGARIWISAFTQSDS
jgi:Holliday junction resolvase RusA-like endonuclease